MQQPIPQRIIDAVSEIRSRYSSKKQKRITKQVDQPPYVYGSYSLSDKKTDPSSYPYFKSVTPANEPSVDLTPMTDLYKNNNLSQRQTRKRSKRSKRSKKSQKSQKKKRSKPMNRKQNKITTRRGRYMNINNGPKILL